MQNIYNLNLIISEHFDIQINFIDIHVEELICKFVKEAKSQEDVNDERDKIIYQIEKLRDTNLDKNRSRQKDFEKEWQHIIEDNKMSYQNKLELFKKIYIKPDCFLVKDLNYTINYSLWITNWFNERAHVEFR